MIEAVTGFVGAFFLLGSFWFWVVAAVVFGSLVALADHEENFWAGVVTMTFLLGIFHFNQLTINWSLVPWVILLYLILGAVMSFIKWITFLKIRASKYVDLKLEWRLKALADGNQVPPIDKTTNMREVLSDEAYANFISYLKSNDFLSYGETRIIPMWKDKYKKLVSWALWWPAVIFWSLLNDHIMGAVKYMVKAMRGWYEGLAAKVFANVGVTMDDNNDLGSRR